MISEGWPPRLELHLYFDADSSLAAALAAAGITPEGPIGVAEVWVTKGGAVQGSEE